MQRSAKSYRKTSGDLLVLALYYDFALLGEEGQPLCHDWYPLSWQYGRFISNDVAGYMGQRTLITTQQTLQSHIGNTIEQVIRRKLCNFFVISALLTKVG